MVPRDADAVKIEVSVMEIQFGAEAQEKKPVLKLVAVTLKL